MMERAKLRRRLQFLIQLQQLRRRRCLIREIFQSHDGYGAFETLFNVLRNDRELFFHYIRMTHERFDHILSVVKEQIEKKDTCFRKSIPPTTRLAITLRYLASGETQQYPCILFILCGTYQKQLETGEQIHKDFLLELYLICFPCFFPLTFTQNDQFI